MIFVPEKLLAHQKCFAQGDDTNLHDPTDYIHLYTNHTTEMTETKQKNVPDLFCQCPVKPPKPGGSHDFGVSFAGSSRALCSAALLNWPRGRNWPGDEPIESTKIYMSQRMSHDITTQGFKSWLYLVHLSVDLYYLLVCFLY